MTSIYRSLIGAIHLVLCSGVIGAEVDKPLNPRFDAKGALMRPESYRDWIFVGSSLGLRYDSEVKEGRSGPEKDLDFKNVYINPAAYREFARSGTFPDGTMLLLEIASMESKKEPGLQGTFQKEFIRLEAAVKDSRRFDKAWAYFSFSDRNGALKETATAFAQKSCFDCHREKAAIDNVFVQFYPVLRLADPLKRGVQGQAR